MMPYHDVCKIPGVKFEKKKYITKLFLAIVPNHVVLTAGSIIPTI